MLDSPVHHVGVGHGHVGEGRQLHEYVENGAWVEPVGVSKVHGQNDQGEPREAEEEGERGAILKPARLPHQVAVDQAHHHACQGQEEHYLESVNGDRLLVVPAVVLAFRLNL